MKILFQRYYDYGGFSITKSKTGWIVSGYTLIQHQFTNVKCLVKPFLNIQHSANLENYYSDSYTIGELIAEKAFNEPDKIISKGTLVK
jgi:hypothetical protein